MKIRFGFFGFLVALTAVASLAQDINYEAGITLNVSDGALAPYYAASNRYGTLTQGKSALAEAAVWQAMDIRVKQSEKRHFADPSISCALLNLTEEKLINDLETFGFLFEAMVERDLKIYANSFDAKVYHYQDYLNREIDSVIELEDGNWCAFEIKLGVNQIESAAKNLLDIQNSIKAENGKAPSVLCVICGMSNAAYKRSDGVYVVPITALKN